MSIPVTVHSGEARKRRKNHTIEMQEPRRIRVSSPETEGAVLVPFPKPTSKPTSKPPLGRKIVHIHVGPEEQDFSIHSDIVCHYSPYFRAAFNSGYKESNSGIMILTETDVSVFELFYHWLYYQTVWNSEGGSESWPQLSDLIKLYIFADMVQIPALCNNAINAIESISKRSNAISTKSFVHAWQHSPENSPLRRLLVDIMVWTAGSAVLDKLVHECFAHDSGKAVLMDVMQAMRTAMKKQLLLNQTSGKHLHVSPLRHIENYYMEEADNEKP